MQLSEHEIHPIAKLLQEVERKLQLAKTSTRQHSEKGRQTLKERSIQIDVLKALLSESQPESVGERRSLNNLKEWTNSVR